MDKKWYASKGSGDQGIIYEENTGNSIAVSYNVEDARLIAAAPELLEFVKDIERYLLAGAIKTKSNRKYVINRAISLIEATS